MTGSTVSLTRRAALRSLGFGSLGLLLAACGGASTSAPTDFSARFARFEPADEPNGDLTKVVWPEFVTGAGPDVRRLYEFQVTNGDLMRYMPCFCGCGASDGHRSNRDCYIKQVNPDGSVVLDDMAPT